MRDLLVLAAGVVALAWLLSAIDRRDRRITWLTTELAAAETDLRAAGGNPRRRGTPILPPAALAAGPIALGQTTGPTTAELWLWLVATDQMAATVTGRPRHTAEADTCWATA